MQEEAQEIFDFLPIRKVQTENDYINHLWNSFLALDTSKSSATSFTVMPFHLLFMMALQYKILRIHNEHKTKYDLALTIKIPHNNEEVAILTPTDPFIIGFFKESEIADLCKIIGFEKSEVKKIKVLIKYRNDKVAHAKGGIEPFPDKKIEEYLDILRNFQRYLEPMNDAIANKWLIEKTTEDDSDEFIETRLLNTYLCPADFKTGILASKFGIFGVGH